jgi:hypothetical protein
MSEYWMVFPLSQVGISIIAGFMTIYYGKKSASHMGGGVLQSMIYLAASIAFILALYTIFGLWAYFSGNEIGRYVQHTLILIMSLLALVMGYYLMKFSKALESLGSED